MTLGLLAIPGVLLSAVVTGAVASLVLDLPFTEGLLIGAVLAPTDPAILIPLFVGSRLRAKVAQTVIAESAVNDPTGAILALAVAGALLSGESSLTGPAAEFLGAARAQHRRRRAGRRDPLREPSPAAARGSGATPRRSPCSPSSR